MCLRCGDNGQVEAISSLTVGLHEHVACASHGDGLDEDFITGMVGRAAALNNEGSLPRARIIQIAAYDLLDCFGETDHGGNALCCFYFSDPIRA